MAERWQDQDPSRSGDGQVTSMHGISEGEEVRASTSAMSQFNTSRVSSEGTADILIPLYMKKQLSYR